MKMSRGIRSKTLALFVVLTMLMTAMTTLRYVTNVEFIGPAEATPGIDKWQGNTTGAAPILNMSTEDLYYGNTVDLIFNGSILKDVSGDIWLYYPEYTYGKVGGYYSYNVTWRAYGKIMYDSDTGKWIIEDVNLNHSGIWVICNVSSGAAEDVLKANMTNSSNMQFYYQADDWKTIIGWFWVNSTQYYDVEVSPSTIHYDANETVTITVKHNDEEEGGVWCDIRKGDTLIRHEHLDTGTWSFNPYNYTHNYGTGNYTVWVYKDLDETILSYGDEGPGSSTTGYNETFGNHSVWTSMRIVNSTGEENYVNETTYYYESCGPFDPPEYLTKVNFTVTANEPILEVKNETQYYNFSCEITGNVTITVKDSNGNYLNVTNAIVKLFNTTNDIKNWNPVDDTYLNITKIDANITIGPNMTACGNDGGWGRANNSGTWVNWIRKGTVYVVVSINTTGDSEPEWNGTATFTITSAPALEIVLVDDDGSLSTNNKDGVIPRVPYNTSSDLPVRLSFYVIKGSKDSYESSLENITISGNALFLENGMTLKEYKETFGDDSVSYSSGTWTVYIIPTMGVNGGKITITAKSGNNVATKEILVGGAELNGSIVTLSPSEFVIGENQTLTVTVTGPEGVVKYPNAFVCLYYLNTTGGLHVDAGKEINYTAGGGTTDGEYTFLFNVTQQTDGQETVFGSGNIKAPRYIIAYVNVTNVGAGYAYAVMKPKSDLKAKVSRSTLMAGQYTEFYLNVTTVDPLTGNETGTPSNVTGMHVIIYNESGENVTGNFGWPSYSSISFDEDGSYLFQAAITEPGTYTIYVYNNTHNSEGFNATVEVVPVEVSFDKEELIWMYDDNTSVTFTVTWQGEPVNGTLTIFGIKDAGTYNQTWANYSCTSWTGDWINVTVTNGVATVYNITANNLSSGVSIENITFKFTPEETNSKPANATGVLPVRIPHVTATPDMVALGETATIEVKLTGREVGLEGFNVTLKGPGDLNLTAKSDSQGIARFSFLPTATGEVEVYVENRLAPDVTIEITSHQLSIDAPSQVYEDQEFTVTVTDENDQPVEGAQVTFNGDTKQTDSNGQVTFTGAVFGNLPYATYTITAQKAGYKSAKTDITIVNVPQLYVSISPEGTLTSGQKFKVKVTSDTGAVYGVHVKVLKDGELIAEGTVTAPEGVTLTAPTVSKETTYTVIVEKEGYKSAEIEIKVKPGGIPGFELVTLIAAIGVAFILLRRRQQH